ncbi:FAD-binding protein, partial [Vogesella mureinivorans]|uniref:FAD-binding protein n=1 Tax=Vogesella mureinivorans TaxID=657276 RepID=UPI0011CCA40C
MRAEVLIVGSGIAALSAALAAAPRRVLILTPGRLGLDGASHWAQGGIAAAIGAGDSPHSHAQ